MKRHPKKAVSPEQAKKDLQKLIISLTRSGWDINSILSMSPELLFELVELQTDDNKEKDVQRMSMEDFILNNGW